MACLSRRALLAASTALAACGPARATSRRAGPRPIRIAGGPPKAPLRPVREMYYGQLVTDPYRWMESEDAEWRAYVRAEGDYAKAVLDKIPGRDKLAAAIDKNSEAVTSVDMMQIAGPHIFTQRRPPDAGNSRLYVRDGLSGTDRLLIDPEHFSEPGTHAALDWWAASPDGASVAFGISQGGSEHSVLHVLATATGAVSPLAITRTDDANPSWLPDSSGFFYNRYQDVPADNLHYEENSSAWLHLLGNDPARDTRLIGPGIENGIALTPIDEPAIVATPGSDILIAQISSGVQNEVSLFMASLRDTLAGKPAWTRICGPADQVTDFTVRGTEIFLLTHKHASHYRVLKITMANPRISTAKVVVPQSRAIIQTLAAAQDGIYLLDLAAGLGRLRRLGMDGKVTELKLPFAGAIDTDSFYADTLHAGAWFQLQGWVRPPVICQAHADGRVNETSLAPQPDIDVTPYTSEEILAPARDGARVPLSVIYRKGLKRNGTTTLLMEAYGAYGITLDPSFMARWLPFLDEGAVFAVAHVRGGGELGEDWHLAGQKAAKYHSWQDAEDCALHLIRLGYTSHRSLGVVGGSAGGITVGRLMTERPELAAVVVSLVGVSDPLRSEFSPNGPPNIPEFGSVKTERGFHDLFAMDAYQHVHNGVDYPSVLLTTGLHDPRVSPWEATKMTARLQAATASKNPVLLRVEADAGHGFGSTRAQRVQETTDVMAFTLWRTGHPGFQPPG
ncbi:MAG: prolyl oligopeptidase family serine peptidase [Rhodospirillales bacterium]|nr:prolyl oligopeptidase family serine peptidase [Rhodospirillales bacterium]